MPEKLDRALHLPREPSWTSFKDDDAVAALVDDIYAVGHDMAVRILCGDAHPDVYNDERFIDASREVVERKKAKIRVITGPVIALDPVSNDNGILRLHRDGYISELLHRVTRGSTEHFRVVETIEGLRYYIEAPHTALAVSHVRRSADLATLPSSELDLLANRAVSFFDGIAQTLADTVDPESSGLPILMTVEQLLRTRTEAEHRGLQWDTLTLDAILPLSAASSEPRKIDPKLRLRAGLLLLKDLVMHPFSSSEILIDPEKRTVSISPQPKTYRLPADH